MLRGPENKVDQNRKKGRVHAMNWWDVCNESITISKRDMQYTNLKSNNFKSEFYKINIKLDFSTN